MLTRAGAQRSVREKAFAPVSTTDPPQSAKRPRPEDCARGITRTRACVARARACEVFERCGSGAHGGRGGPRGMFGGHDPGCTACGSGCSLLEYRRGRSSSGAAALCSEVGRDRGGMSLKPGRALSLALPPALPLGSALRTTTHEVSTLWDHVDCDLPLKPGPAPSAEPSAVIPSGSALWVSVH